MLKMEVRKVHLGDGLAGILLSGDGLAAVHPPHHRPSE